jgi:hypothetical protein
LKITPTYNSGIQLEFEEGYLVIHEVDGKLQIRAPKGLATLLSTKHEDYAEVKVEILGDERSISISVPEQDAPDF